MSLIAKIPKANFTYLWAYLTPIWLIDGTLGCEVREVMFLYMERLDPIASFSKIGHGGALR